MDRTAASHSAAAHVLGPTAISVLAHGVGLILCLALSTSLQTGKSDGRYQATAVPVLDEVVEDDGDLVALRPLPMVEFEELELVPDEMELFLLPEEIDLPAVPVPEEVLPSLEPMDAPDTHVPSMTLPTLAAASRRVGPEPVAAPLVQPAPAPRPVVLAATPTLSRPRAPTALRRPAMVKRRSASRGRPLQAMHKPLYYPPTARQRGVQGRTRVELMIDASGHVTGVVLIASSGHADLDRAALASARQWRFRPPGERRRVRTWLNFRLS